MQKLPTLTAFLVVISLCGWQVAFAWQEGAPSAETKTEEKPQTTSVKEDAPQDPQAADLVRQARDRLFNHQTVSADMEQLVSLGAYKFASSGKYFSGSGFKSRLEYEVKLAQMQGRFLEVCDGQILHTRRQIGKVSNNPLSTEVPKIELSRRDIQKILKETRQNLDKPEALQAAEIGIGGLPAVLASLESAMTFDAIRPEAIEGQDYLVVQARWKNEERTELMTGLGPMASQIGGFIPDLVRIYFVKETLFPAKILYLKTASEVRQTYRPMVTIEFTNIKIDEPLPQNTFVYVAPPGVEERDETGIYLQMIQQINQPLGEQPAE